MTKVTQILEAIERSEPQAAHRLLPVVYNELHRIAAQMMAQEKPGQTLQATALVHEAYLRLVDHDPPPRWENRRHFFIAAAEAMRRILVENARRKASLKRGGGFERQELDPAELAASPRPDDLLALDEALDQLAAEDPQKVQLVQLRYFVGLTLEQAAAALGISRATACRHWAYARAWLYDRITGTDAPR